MLRGSVRHFFPGGNTPQGFFSYYDYIIPPDASRIFILKGGPGTGKSTFMKKIGEAMLNKGFDIELHHCSSDNNSLDGVVIPALSIAFIDGTAPHVVDPKNPGCVDEIIHLGDYWQESKIVANKQKIMSCNYNIGQNFKRAYRILSAAKSIYDDWAAANTQAMDFAIANKKAALVANQIFSGIESVGAGKVRKLFASAITPDGAVNYLDSIMKSFPKQYIITGHPGTGKATLVKKLLDTATSKGLHTEAFYCPLRPDKVEHLVIPALQTAVITSVEPHLYSAANPVMTVNMNECLDTLTSAKLSPVTNYDKELFWNLFNKAVSYINAAKKLHDELETYYVPNMDFTTIQGLWEKTLDRVLAYA